jgi:hypothetical protein
MPLLFSSLHRVGHEADEPEVVTAHTTQPGAVEYIHELVDSVVTNANRRSYTFFQNGVDVHTALLGYHTGQDIEHYQQTAASVANRLHHVELQARQRGANLRYEIPRGLLVQAFLQDAISQRLLIVKSDYDEFLDNISFRTRTGLPRKKKVFKAFLAELGLDGEIKDLYVCDSTGSHSKYWWQGFLELQEKWGDAHNTKTLWEALEKNVLNPLKKKFRSDHELLRNSMLVYLRSHDTFVLNEFVQSIEGYDPQDPELPVANIIQSLRALPTKRVNNQFDTSFNIVKPEITARSRKTYHLSDHIDLVVKSGIENLKEDIQSFEEHGIKYIKIRTTDEGFNTFARKQSNDTP